MTTLIQFTPEVLITPSPISREKFIDIRYSKDGGSNWSDWRRLSMGEAGNFVKRLQMRRFGRGRQWVFDVRMTDNVPASILAASIMTEGAQS